MQSIATLMMQAWRLARHVCGRFKLLPDLDRSCFHDAGMKLLDLPQEVLHAIMTQFEAHEWAQGPAQSCRILSKMDLPRLALHLPVRCRAAHATSSPKSAHDYAVLL